MFSGGQSLQCVKQSHFLPPKPFIIILRHRTLAAMIERAINYHV